MPQPCTPMGAFSRLFGLPNWIAIQYNCWLVSLPPPPPPSSSYLSSGSLMEISATQLGAEAIKNTLNKVKLPPSAVEDVMMGLVHLWSFHTFSPRKNNYYWQIWLQTKITIPFKINQTRWNSIYKWTKILTLEITILGFLMIMKSGIDIFILKSNKPLQKCCCPVQKILPERLDWPCQQ